MTNNPCTIENLDFIIVILESGTVLFNYPERLEFDFSLLGGFIRALRQFAKETFHSSLEGILLQDKQFFIVKDGTLFFLFGYSAHTVSDSPFPHLFAKKFRKLFSQEIEKRVLGIRAERASHFLKLVQRMKKRELLAEAIASHFRIESGPSKRKSVAPEVAPK